MRKLLLILLFFGGMNGAAWAQNAIQLVYFENFPPFSWLDQGQMKGMLIDIMTEAFEKRLGITTKHAGYPWTRAQDLVKDGLADAFVTVPTEERRRYTVVSNEVVINANFTPFVHVGNPRFEELKNVKTLAELAKFKVGHYLGSGWAKQNLANMPVEWAPSVDHALNMLLNNRFDVFIDVSQIIRYRIKALGYQDQLVELPNILDTSPFSLCIGKKSSFVNVIPRFDEAMRQMRSDGTVANIMEKY